ncbi:MAG: PIG-L family deacetylase [Bdellovibrionales bacterium]|nr:PIG-L family deacetylase [Bdellovibrionales bacterium]
MKHISDDNIYVPDNLTSSEALKRVTHLAIGAHADDLEIFAIHGILACYESSDKWFGGLTVTDGANSPRTGSYKNTTNEEMVEIRRREQNEAAKIGKYAAQIQLGVSSLECKQISNYHLQEQLSEILLATMPTYIYTHNLVDKHDTHVAVAMHTINAVRALDTKLSIEGFYGCEVWRSLDWMNDKDKVVLGSSDHESLALDLCSVYKSQINGGKPYDKAAMARRISNATFFESNEVDNESAITFAMDYKPLLLDRSLTPMELVDRHLKNFLKDTTDRLKKFSV